MNEQLNENDDLFVDEVPLPEPQPVPADSRKRELIKWVVGGTTVMLFAVAVVFMSVRQSTNKHFLSQENERLRKQIETLNTKQSSTSPYAPLRDPVAENEARVKLAEKIALEKAHLAGFRNHLARLEESNDEYVSLVAETNLSFAQLLSNDAGKRIAARPELVEQFIALRKEQRAQPDELVELEAFVRQFKAMLVDSELDLKHGYQIGNRSRDKLKELAKRVNFHIDSQTKIQRGLRSITDQARNLDNTGSSLELAITEIENKAGELFSAEIQSRIALVEKENQELAIQQAEEIKRRQGEAERQKLLLDAELKRKKDQAIARGFKLEIDELDQQIRDDLAQKKLRQEYRNDLTEIQSVLAPLIANGTSLRGTHGGSGPASLSYIRGKGVLAKNITGLNLMLEMCSGGVYTPATGRDRDDRPLGSFPMYYGGSVGGGRNHVYKKLCVNAQNLLIKYGDLMVEEGLLAK